MKWMTTCKETTELASRAMDEHLPFVDRVALKLHVVVCKSCARFAQQLQEMRHQFRSGTVTDDSTPGLGQEARQRIANKLQKNSALDPTHES